MCGRYVLIEGRKVLATFPMLQQVTVKPGAWDLLPQYNAAPMQQMPVVAIRGGNRSVDLMQWWLVPHWAKQPKTEFSTFNAKAETLAQSRLFAGYFKGSRCLVPADAFYEWKKVTLEKGVGQPKGPGTEKHPMCIRMKDEKPFMMAGLFSVWKSEDGARELATFTIITTQANELLEPIHHRMPVILEEEDHERWIDREYHDLENLNALLKPYPADRMFAYRVSRLINSSRNNREECLLPSTS